MTVAPEKQQTIVDGVTLTIDGIELTVPKGTLVIRAAEQLGIQIPRFCDHPLLEPIGACRQCLVDVEMGGRKMPKPQASCTMTVAEGMVVNTHLTSPVAEKAQRGTIELLLINHPLDCPVCDKGGECPLQNQAMSSGSAESRFRDVKRTYPKPINISSQVLLDRERCVLCARCTRFSEQIAGDPFIELFERSALEQVAIYEDEPFQSYFSGNTVQICPVGALTGASYRFRARPFDLVSTPSICEHCSSGCSQRTDWRRGKVLRRLAGEDPEVNEEWNCDKGRWAFTYATQSDRITTPLVRNESGELEPTSWTDAFARVAEGLAAAQGVGVLTGGRLTLEDAYAYSKFARVVLGTNDVDFRARPLSAEEASFLGSHVAGNTDVTFTALEKAPAVLLVGLEPEEESPSVFLRLRKAWRKKGLKVFGVAPWESKGLQKMGGTLIQAVPGAEAKVLDALARGGGDLASTSEALRVEGAVILIGERLATVPGALSAAAHLAEVTGAKLAWIPRRAGDRGAIEAGLLPGLLPGSRPVTDATARTELELAWGLVSGSLPAEPGRDTNQILAAAAAGELGALIVGAVEIDDLADPAAAKEALDAVGFLVSLELRQSAVTERADVVLPVAPVVEKAGTFVNWEGRVRPFELTLSGTGALTDGRILDSIAAEMDIDLDLSTVEQTRTEWASLPVTKGSRPTGPVEPISDRPQVEAGEAILSSWHYMLDLGKLQDGEPNLAGTARPAVARISPATATESGVVTGEPLSISTEAGTITLPVEVTDMPDRVVWVPTNSLDSRVRPTLGVDSGAVVRIAAAGQSNVEGDEQ